MAETQAPTSHCIDPAGALLGEGPVWVTGANALYWLDIHGRRIHRYEPEGGRRASWETPFRIGSLAPRAAGGFIGGSEHGFVAIAPDFTRFDVLADPEPEHPGNRFNDGKVDPRGRFWAGTMDDAEQASTGALYRLDTDLQWSRQDEGYAVTNGPAFSPDDTHVYHTDSARQTVYRFTLEEPGGTLADKQVFARFSEGEGYPDGMTVDAEGCLWIAFWDGWCLRRLDPAGKVIRRIDLPVQRPTSCAFGGEALDRLYVTSARVGLSPQDIAAQPQAGGLFEIDPGTRGLAAPVFGA